LRRNRQAAGLGLQAAHPPAAAGNAAGADLHMANLEARHVFAADDLALKHAPASDARSGKNANQAAGSLSGSEPILAVHPRIDIVHDHCRAAEFSFQDGADLHVSPAEIGRVEDYSAIEVDISRATDAKARQLP